MVGLWKHLRGNQGIQLFQLNRTLGQLSEQVTSFGSLHLSLTLSMNNCRPSRSFLLHLFIAPFVSILRRAKRAT